MYDGTAVGGLVGLDYAINRYHEPGQGRFTSVDPKYDSASIANPGTWNRYAYASSDPVNRIDPSGLKDCSGYRDASFCEPDSGGSGGTSCHIDPVTLEQICDFGCEAGGVLGLLGTAAGECIEPPPPPPPPPPTATAKPLECDVHLVGSPINGLGALHTYLEWDIFDPNTDIHFANTIEGYPMSKVDPTIPATAVQIFTNQAWLNGYLGDGTNIPPRSGPGGSEIFDFAREYSSGQLCSDIASLNAATARYPNNTITYNVVTRTSNTFTSYLLGQAGMQLPSYFNPWISIAAPGWGFPLN